MGIAHVSHMLLSGCDHVTAQNSTPTPIYLLNYGWAEPLCACVCVCLCMGVWECKSSPATDGSPLLSALMRVAIFVRSFCFQDLLGWLGRASALPSNRLQTGKCQPTGDHQAFVYNIGEEKYTG